MDEKILKLVPAVSTVSICATGKQKKSNLERMTLISKISDVCMAQRWLSGKRIDARNFYLRNMAMWSFPFGCMPSQCLPGELRCGRMAFLCGLLRVPHTWSPCSHQRGEFASLRAVLRAVLPTAPGCQCCGIFLGWE